MGAERTVGALDRAFGALLLLLMVVGAFALWIGVPAGVLWGLGKLVDNKTEHLVLGLLAVPLGMVLFGIVLARLNWTYLRVSGVELRSEEEDGEWVPRLRGPLDRIVGASAVIALVAFLAWMIFGETTTGSVPPW
jgi:ABC-type dipeptide/oligopeptide/nickel transport system permease subunit